MTVNADCKGQNPQDKPHQVFEAVKRSIISILIDVDEDSITPDMSLKDLGANSLDRSEIVVATMEDLDLVFPARELAGVKNIGELVERFCAKMSS